MVRARIGIFTLNEGLNIVILLNKSENFETVTKLNILLQKSDPCKHFKRVITNYGLHI